MICIAFQAKRGVMGFSHPRLRPGLLAPLVAFSRRFLSNSGGSFQH